MDELIAALPSRVVEAMSAKDIEALASGDPQAVARILLADTPAGNSDDSPLPGSGETPEARAAQPPADSGPERISLRGLAAQDRIALADMVRAVKEGRFASLDEARAALQPPVAAEHNPRAAAPEAAAQPADPALTPVLQRLAQLQSLQQEAAQAYDTTALLHLDQEMAAAQTDLRQAETARQSSHHRSHYWAHDEAHHIASQHQQLSTDMADTAFAQALKVERDMAEYHGDPLMDTPDWSLRLAERVRQRMPRPAAGGARPQARARGMVASPSARGGAALSLDEAFDQIEGMSESEVDAVLSQMREREQASRFSRAP